MNTIVYQKRPEDTYNWTNLYLEPHDYPIFDVKIDLRHQYGISATESQTFLRAKRPQRRKATRNGCFRRLQQKIDLLKLLKSWISQGLVGLGLVITSEKLLTVFNFTVFSEYSLNKINK